ncbi:unnamed protein product [Oppiella nova]|uniref:NR LBD domain-containing protein n=1 Tax=Oppiella nova TaxID=334625 RepID=A0A7R9LF59_9ACAR|nr:unnamed protein product [Oppiella nova]CAG2162334.1 unnamed protein product [Oppiella nova]
MMLIKLTSLLKNMIKINKHLQSFQSVCEDDKLILIRDSCVEFLYLRSALVFDYENGCLTIPITENESISVHLDVIKLAPHNVYTPLKNLLNTFKSDSYFDTIVIELMRAILLFNPNHPNLSHRDVVK